MAKKRKKTIFELKINFLEHIYSYEIAHLAKFYTVKTHMYFKNEHMLFFLLFPGTVLVVHQNWFKIIDFFGIFVKSWLNSNFYKAIFLIMLKSLQIKFCTTLDLCHFLLFVL